MNKNRNLAARYYWQSRFQDFNIVKCFEDPAVNTAGGAREMVILPVDPAVITQLYQVAGSEVSRGALLLAVVSLLAYKCSHEENVCIFTPAATGGKLIPFRAAHPGNHSFHAYLKLIAGDYVNDNRYSDYLSDTFLPGAIQDAVGLTWHNWPDHEPKPGLLFQFSLASSALHIYAGEAYSAAYARQTGTYCLHLLQAALADPEGQVSALPLQAPSVLSEAAAQFNSTATALPAAQTILDVFRAKVAEHPGAIAFEYAGSSYDYHALDAWSDKVAAFLISRYHIKKGELVCILLGREEWLLPVILGVMKTGAVYVPVDPVYAEGRIDEILQTPGTALVITRNAFRRNWQNLAVMNLDEEHKAVFTSPEIILPHNSGETLAYILFTSGSTGVPKGVMIPHRSLLNYIHWAAAYYVQGHAAVSPLFTSISFDLTVTALFMPLYTGGTVLVAPEQAEENIVAAWLANDRVTVIKVTPSQLKTVLYAPAISINSNKPPKKIIVGGEAFPAALAFAVYEKLQGHVEIYNEYGPTEATVGCMIHRYTPAEEGMTVPVGTPVFNTGIYLLDEHLCHVPDGIPGHLYIAGTGLAAGYIHQPALTAEKFIDNPFAAGSKMYKTGDIAVRDIAGRLYYKGRADDQVKIRGFRIEPGEIEQRITQYEGVNAAVVVLRKRVDDAYLSAFYEAGREVTPEKLRAYLAGVLPAYMLPAFFTQLPRLPLTVNGKVNRNALPEEVLLETQITAPATDTEHALRNLWAAVLQLGEMQISTSRSFFELGGHSLKAMELTSAIRSSMQKQLPLRFVFSHTTISAQAALLDTLPVSHAGSMIAPAPLQKYYPLSSAQRRLYFLQQYASAGTAYNMPRFLQVKGNLQPAKLEEAFRQLLQRHEILRTRFVLQNGEPVQEILETIPFSITHYTEDDDAAMKDFVRPFDLATGGLVKVGLLRQSESAYLLMLDIHHIVTDGISQTLLTNELMSLYNGAGLPAVSLHYKDYVQWMQCGEQQALMESHAYFWADQFRELPPATDLPADYERPAVKDYRGASFSFHFTVDETARLQQFARQENVTMFMLLLAVYNVLLAHLSANEDIVTGTGVAGREHPDTRKMMGMFVNTLALRNYPEGTKTFKAFLAEVRKNTLSCFEHQAYPFEALTAKLQPERNESRHPLFDVMFAYNNFETGELAFGDLAVEVCPVPVTNAKFDLMLTVSELDQQLSLDFNYALSLFSAATVSRFADYFRHIALKVTDNPLVLLQDGFELPAGEQQALLAKGDNTAGFKMDQTINALFDTQVKRSPEAIALKFRDQVLTYAALNDQANRLAAYLVNAGVTTGILVPLCVRRSIDQMVAILAILKAGGAYAPIDSDYPEPRVKYLLDDLQAPFVLADDLFTVAVDVPVLHLPTVLAGLDKNAPCPAPVAVSPEDLAYINYTSGSTGNPKGVLIRHGSVIRLLDLNDMVLDNSTVTLQLSSISFDAATFEIWASLLSGGTVVVYPDTYIEADVLNNVIATHQVNTLWLTIGLLEQWSEHDIDHLKIRYVLTGGDIVHPEVIARVHRKLPEVTLYSCYGQTENTTFTSLYKTNRNSTLPRIPIGSPIAGTSVYVLNKALALTPPGTVGELFTGGAGLATGYLHNEALTGEKFIDHPFCKNEKLYRTGDLAKWMPDGNLVFAGRADSQVKIRGFRVEPGEIESVLIRHQAIQEVAVSIREVDREKCLVAYYVAAEPVSADQLRAYLSALLPAYMIPGYFMALPKFPLSSSGKIDRKALPAMLAAPETGVLPTTATEKALATIWSQLLKLPAEKLPADKSFFELGGHSLTAMELINRIAREMQQRISLRTLFAHNKIRDLAAWVDAQQVEKIYSKIPRAPQQECYELTAAQQRLYFLQAYEPQSVSYNMPQYIRLKGRPDLLRLEKAFQDLQQLHHNLRTRFVFNNGRPMQEVMDTAGISIIHYHPVAGNIEPQLRKFVQPFQLEQGPPIRLGWITISADEQVLLLDMHHIITDGITQQILVRDLVTLYNGQTPNEPALQYEDYAAWVNSGYYQELIRQQGVFWQQLYYDIPQTLQLPQDYDRPLVKDNTGANFSLQLSLQETAALQQLAAKEDVTIFMLLMAVYNVLLHRLSGQEDIVVGTPVSGRQHPDLGNIAGLFVNTLAMRNRPSGAKTFSFFLQEVRSHTLACLEHQDYPFTALITALQLPRTTAHHPLFEVFFAFENFQDEPLEMEGVEASSFSASNDVAKFDLVLTAREAAKRLHCDFTYAVALFNEATVARFAGYFHEILKTITDNPGIALADIRLIPEAQLTSLIGEGYEQANYPQSDTIIRLFEQQLHHSPNAVAAVFNGTPLTYYQLSVKVNALTAAMRGKGVGHGDKVVVLIDHSFELLVSILATMKCGAAFVPVDTGWPLLRQQECVARIRPALVLCNADHDAAQWEQGFRVSLSHLHDPGVVAATPVSGDDLVYIIFTSGSTGTPKGVAVCYAGLMNRLHWMNDCFGAAAAGSVLHTTRYVYDSAVWELCWPLMNGGKTIITEPAVLTDTLRMLQLIDAYKVTIADFVPSVFNTLLEQIEDGGRHRLPASLQYVILGGEEMSGQKAHRFYQYYPDVRIINLYGPTEATIGCVYHEVQLNETGRIPIGKAIANVSLRIMDKYGNDVPPGVSGELWIAGVCLAREYYGEPSLTAERFVTEPRTGVRYYKTGDQVRCLPNGNIDFMGRIDDQVKLRGYRIELGEIMNRLSAYPAVRESVVVIKEQGRAKYIVAYYVAAAPVAPALLGNFLAGQLPAYMIPSYFCHLKELPMIPGGKVNRALLPEPEWQQTEGYVVPAGYTEELLAGIWSSLLEISVTAVSAQANFFEMGGNSLMLVSLVSKVTQTLQVPLHIADVFRYPTIASLAAFLNGAAVPANEKEPAVTADSLSSTLKLFDLSE
ncbi:non-ribosomal peptide synthetase [Chitinophaga costaii]|nr:non-ribosomal peptide synthetase [Chitinophaga costaii]